MATVAELMVTLTNKAGDLSDLVNTTASQLTPAPQLINTFGPLTDALTQSETLVVASHLLGVLRLGSIQDPDRIALEKSLAAVVGALTNSSINTTNSSLLTLLDVVKLDNLVDAAGKSVVDKVKTNYTSTQPKVFQALDVGVAVGATAIPFAGPLVGGFIMGGPKAAVALELGAVGTYFAPNVTGLTGFAPPKDGPVNSGQYDKAMQGAPKDVLKDGGKDAALTGELDKKFKDSLANKDLLLSSPSSFGIGLVWWGIMRIKLGMSEEAIKAAMTSGRVIFSNESAANQILSQSINPQTRNQLAVGSRINEVIDSSKRSSNANQIDNIVNTKSGTLLEFTEKVKTANKAVSAAFKEIIYLSIARSFGPELRKWKEVINKLAIIRGGEDYKLGTSFDAKYDNVIALLVISYYYLEGSRRQNPSFDPNRLEYSETSLSLNRLAPTPAAANSPLANVADSNAKEAFEKSQSFLKTSLWPQIEQKSVRYVEIIKDALVEDLGRPFSSNRDGKSITNALELYFTCAMIVVDNISRKEAGATTSTLKRVFVSTSTQIPDGAIEILSKLGFLNKYTTWTGTVSDEQKRQHTAGGKLRYYGGIKGSSRSEKMMVFVFSLLVISVVDVVQICAGFQDWKQTEKLLHKIIEKINDAEIEMDRNADIVA